MADTFQNNSIQARLSLIFPLLEIRLAWGLKQIPRKNKRHMSIFNDFLTKSVKKLLTRNRIFNQIVVRKSHTIGLLLFFFRGICFKPHPNLTSINGNIKESLT